MLSLVLLAVIAVFWLLLGDRIAGAGALQSMAFQLPELGILSLAMMLRFSLNQPEAALRIEAAVTKVLESGLRTADIWSEGTQRVGTREMGDAVVAALSGKTTSMTKS